LNQEAATVLAIMLQKQLTWDQSQEKLEELTCFVLDNVDDSLSLNENMAVLIELHQKQAHQEATAMGMQMM